MGGQQRDEVWGVSVSEVEQDSPVDGVEADEGDGEGNPGDPFNVTGPHSTQCCWCSLGNMIHGSRQQIHP